jgi:DNA (cytosine-5)-methyltransferase 1
MNDVKVIDLFCGIGGLTYGMQRQGFNVVAGIDNDPKCEYGYMANNNAKYILDDISNISAETINDMYGDAKVKVLVGCAPCQPYSGLNNKKPSKEKMQPLEKFASLIEQIRPDIVSMENVRGLAKEGKYPVFQKFIRTLKRCGYSVSYQVVDVSNYGVPQNRKRLVLLASRHGDISLISPTHKDSKVTVRDTIAGLPPIAAGVKSDEDVLHYARALSPLNMQRIRATKHDGGNSADWPEELRLECHKKASGKTYEQTVYGRMRWDAPAPTMTTQCIGLGNGRFGHPEQDRAITLREAALIQTFPANYKFSPKNSPMIVKDIARFIGNAVPVRLGEVIASSIKLHLSENALVTA